MNFLGGSFPVGRLFGITIRVHVLFLFYVAFRVLDAAQGHGDWQTALLFLLMLFGIVLLHEFGHCFGARAVGGYAEDILMWPLGGLAYAHAPMRPWPQFVTVAAGPLVNVALCLLSAGAIYMLSGGSLLPGVNPLDPELHVVRTASESVASLLRPEWLPYVFIFYHVNLFILGFNLLPIFPLDGGQIFRAILWPFLGLQRASLVAAQVGLLGCVVLGLLGLRGGGGMLFFIAIFGALTCWQHLQAARAGVLVEDPVGYSPRRARSGGFWSRIFGRAARPRFEDGPVEFANPHPGGWAARQAELEAEERELDRILRKVSEQGIHSLTYVERETLQRITRARQERERELERQNRR